MSIPTFREATLIYLGETAISVSDCVGWRGDIFPLADQSKRFDKWHCRSRLQMLPFAGMSITAIIEQGKIVLPANVQWPSETVVRIEPVGDQPPTLWETLKDFDGVANDLPADLADNLDHYVHGSARS